MDTIPKTQRLIKSVRELLARHPLAAFTVLAYLLAWPVWFFAAAAETPSLFLTWLGGFAPAVAAFILTAALDGREGLRRLLARAFVWRINPLWYLAALGIPVLGTLVLSVLYALTQRDFSYLQSMGPWLASIGKNSPVLLLTLLLGLVVVAGEEFGWRGYVLPKLRASRTDLASSLAVGVIWGVWHLPDLWPFQAKHDALDLALFMADILTISILYTWLYINSRESILLVSLFHAAYDLMVMVASATLPFLRTARGYELVVVLIFSGCIVGLYGPRRFQRSHPEPVRQSADSVLAGPRGLPPG